MTLVKICGLKNAEMVRISIAANADFIGFVFVEKSPRFIRIAEAQPLIEICRNAGVKTVGLWQGAGSLPLEDVTSSGIDILQAHGTDPGLVNLTTWYAMGVSAAEDLPKDILPYDQLLFDAKPPKGAAIEGGHGARFDWTILRAYQAKQPWMLAGGLTPQNVAEAIQISGARAVDVSSGVERVKGEKDAGLIQDFIQAAKAADKYSGFQVG